MKKVLRARNEDVTPFEAAQKIWDIRVGSLATRNANWRFAALFALFIALIAVIGLLYLMTIPKIQPYIIEIGPDGRVVNYGRMIRIEDYSLSEPVIRYNLVRLLENMYTITNDPVIIKRNWMQVYGHVTIRGSNMLNEMWNQIQPLERVGTERADIEVIAYLNRGEKTREIDFVWRIWNEAGTLRERQKNKAIVQYVIRPGEDEATLQVNPIGLYIDFLAVSEVKE